MIHREMMATSATVSLGDKILKDLKNSRAGESCSHSRSYRRILSSHSIRILSQSISDSPIPFPPAHSLFVIPLIALLQAPDLFNVDTSDRPSPIFITGPYPAHDRCKEHEYYDYYTASLTDSREWLLLQEGARLNFPCDLIIQDGFTECSDATELGDELNQS